MKRYDDAEDMRSTAPKRNGEMSRAFLLERICAMIADAPYQKLEFVYWMLIRK